MLTMYAVARESILTLVETFHEHVISRYIKFHKSMTERNIYCNIIIINIHYTNTIESH